MVEKNIHAQELGRLGGRAGKGKSKARKVTSEQARRAVNARWAKVRLEYLRKELRAERISYGELAELQGLVPFIEPNDVELLEAAGVPESWAVWRLLENPKDAR